MLLYDDGICVIYEKVNTAESGKKPVIKLREVDRFYYGDDQVFYKRFFTAKAAGSSIDRMIHVEGKQNITGEHMAVLEDGLQYKVVQSQPGTDRDGMDATWLSLERMAESYGYT